MPAFLSRDTKATAASFDYIVVGSGAVVAARLSENGLWCSDVERARAIAGRLRVGRVRINGCPLDKRSPHGGFKLSGIGREWGRFGIKAFLDYKSVIG
jgi:acyl-CoA reductase-like NAD-dependent aldehyde dehydrogenase